MPQLAINGGPACKPGKEFVANSNNIEQKPTGEEQ